MPIRIMNHLMTDRAIHGTGVAVSVALPPQSGGDSQYGGAIAHPRRRVQRRNRGRSERSPSTDTRRPQDRREGRVHKTQSDDGPRLFRGD